MKKIMFVLLMGSLFLANTVFALTFINNSTRAQSVTINGNSSNIKPQAIVGYEPPRKKLPYHISVSGKTSGGRAYHCSFTESNADAMVTIPDRCVTPKDF